MLRVTLTKYSSKYGYGINQVFNHVTSVNISNGYKRELRIRYLKDKDEIEKVTIDLPEYVEIQQEEEK